MVLCGRDQLEPHSRRGERKQLFLNKKCRRWPWDDFPIRQLEADVQQSCAGAPASTKEAFNNLAKQSRMRFTVISSAHFESTLQLVGAPTTQLMTEVHAQASATLVIASLTFDGPWPEVSPFHQAIGHGLVATSNRW